MRGVAVRRRARSARDDDSAGHYPVPMCRNITELRGLEPVATAEEIEAAARQYIRKVSGIQTLSDTNREAFEHAVADVTAITSRLLVSLPRAQAAARYGPAAPAARGAGPHGGPAGRARSREVGQPVRHVRRGLANP